MSDKKTRHKAKPEKVFEYTYHLMVLTGNTSAE